MKKNRLELEIKIARFFRIFDFVPVTQHVYHLSAGPFRHFFAILKPFDIIYRQLSFLVVNLTKKCDLKNRILTKFFEGKNLTFSDLMRISSDDAFSLILFNVLCEYLATSEDSSFSFLMCPSRPLTNSAISAGNICCFTGTGAAASLLVDSVAAAYPEPPRPGLVAVDTAGAKK